MLQMLANEHLILAGSTDLIYLLDTSHSKNEGNKASITHGTLKYATASLAPTCVLRENKFWRATWAFFLYRELCWGQMRQHADI